MLHCIVQIDTDTYIQTHTYILNAFELSTINFPFFWPYHMECGILIFWPGIELTPPALEVWRLNQWTTREVPSYIFQSSHNISCGKWPQAVSHRNFNSNKHSKSSFHFPLISTHYGVKSYSCNLVEHWLLLPYLWTELEFGRKNNDYNLHSTDTWLVASGKLPLREHTQENFPPFNSLEKTCQYFSFSFF